VKLDVKHVLPFPNWSVTLPLWINSLYLIPVANGFVGVILSVLPLIEFLDEITVLPFLSSIQN